MMGGKKICVVLLGSLLVVGFMLSLGLGDCQAAPAKKHVWKFQSIYTGTGQATMMGCWDWADYIQKGTNGEITFEKYHSSQLVPAAKALDALEKGTLDVLFAGGGSYIGVTPYADFFSLPACFTDNFYAMFDFLWNTDGGKLMKEWFMKDKSVYMVMPIPASGMITFTKPGKTIKTLADYKGKNVQISAGTLAKIIQTLGGVPVTGLNISDIYTALQRGTVDAASWVTYSFENIKLYEVCSAVTVPGMMAPTGPVLWISGKSWNKLSDPLKAKIEEASRWNAVRLTEYAWDEYKNKVPFWCNKYKMEYNVLSAEDQKKLKEVQQNIGWGEFAKRDPRNAQLIAILKDYIKTKFPKEFKRTW